MKSRIVLAAALMTLTAGSVFAQKTEKTVDEVRIYINPGHGSWTANDRPMQTIGREAYSSTDTDTTGFFESNTNLQKGFALLDKLVEIGVPFNREANQTGDNPARIGAALDLSQHIVMSHVKAGPYPNVAKDDPAADDYNRNLTEIREEVEANNFDIFISIHSNAASEGSSTNYPLFLYRGKDDGTYAAGDSKEMCTHIWPYTYNNAHQVWSYYSATDPNVRGDVSFYGEGYETENNGNIYVGYLGVLRHGVPGFLVEGYFHTYQPSRQRAMNFDVDRHEGELYARGLIDYMGWTPETKGEIYGIVRDLHEKFSDKLYSPAARSNDVYKPLNGVVVKLFKDDVEVATYTTDNEWNGAFLFNGLEPGTYTISYAAEGYKEAFEEYLQPITVEANKTAYITAFLEAEGYEPPAIVYENYLDALEGKGGYSVAGTYNMTKIGETLSPLAEQLAGKTVRRQILRGNILYVLALDEANEPYIYAANINDNTVTEISTAGTTLEGNRTLKISDIAFSADNVLIATNYGESQYSDSQVAEGDTRGVVAIYKWANDELTGMPTGDAQIWFTSQNSGNYYNAYTGQTIAYSGTIEEGAVMITAQTKGSAKSLRFVEFGIANGELVSTTHMNKVVSAESNYTVPKIGEDYQLVVSPSADDQYVIDGSVSTPMEWKTAASGTDTPLLGRINEELSSAESTGATFFKWAGHNIMVAPEKTDGMITDIRLIDVTAGFDNARGVLLGGVEIEEGAAVCANAFGQGFADIDEEGNVTDAYFNIYLVRDGKIEGFTTKNVEQPMIRGDYAYDLSVSVDEGVSTFKFKTTGIGTGIAAIQFAPAHVAEVTDETGIVTIPIIVNKGENSVEINNVDIPEGELVWSVVIGNQPAGKPTKLFSDVTYSNCRGVAIDNNFESPYFGTIYTGNSVAGTKAKGIYKFNPDLSPINTEAIANAEFVLGNTASPFRMSVMPDGTLLAADWSDAHSGLFMLNPETDELTNIFGGTRASGGEFIVEGAIIGGGTTCSSTLGEGENLQLFTFCEDYPTSNSGQKLVRYDLGNQRLITWAPNYVFEDVSTKMVNTNVEVRATENGLWVSQTRNAGNNNSSVPSIVYCDLEGNILYNSGVSNADDLLGTNGSGFAINCSNDMMAIVNDAGDVNIYDLTWADNVPTLTYRYTVDKKNEASSEMAFDVADNLYIASKTEFQVWSLPKDDEYVSVVSAPTTITINESSVNKISANNVSRIYPNPASDIVNIEASEAISNIAVFNAMGGMVAGAETINGNTATIRVSSLASGIYFVRVNNGKAVKIIKK